MKTRYVVIGEHMGCISITAQELLSSYRKSPALFDNKFSRFDGLPLLPFLEGYALRAPPLFLKKYTQI